jgi:hypothetical protein
LTVAPISGMIGTWPGNATTMRLTKAQTEQAKAELLDIIERTPGIRTSELVGTKQFHGKRTLRPKQITRLLRDSGRAIPTLDGYGARTYHTWRLA